MAKDDDKLTVEGTVIEALPGTQSQSRIGKRFGNTRISLGKMRRHYIRFVGRSSSIEISPYDLTRGRIVYRYRRHSAEPDDFNKPVLFI